MRMEKKTKSKKKQLSINLWQEKCQLSNTWCDRNTFNISNLYCTSEFRQVVMVAPLSLLFFFFFQVIIMTWTSTHHAFAIKMFFLKIDDL